MLKDFLPWGVIAKTICYVTSPLSKILPILSIQNSAADVAPFYKS